MRKKPEVIIIGMGAQIHSVAQYLPTFNHNHLNKDAYPLRLTAFVWKKKDGSWWFCEGEKPINMKDEGDKIIYRYQIRNPWLCMRNGQHVTVEVKNNRAYII